MVEMTTNGGIAYDFYYQMGNVTPEGSGDFWVSVDLKFRADTRGVQVETVINDTPLIEEPVAKFN